MQRWSETPCTHSSKQPPQCDDEAGIAAQCKLLFHDKNACCAGQFWRNTNWFMTGMVLAWVSITIGYVVVRATQSLKGLSTGILIYGIWVLVVEVRPLPCPALPCPALAALCCAVIRQDMLCKHALSALFQVHKHTCRHSQSCRGPQQAVLLIITCCHHRSSVLLYRCWEPQH